ncbi:unnamed protein product, partial [Rotaria sp. Silwood1]
VLYVNSKYEDIAYFNANQWKQLIQQYIPELKKFCLAYYESNTYEHKILNNSSQLSYFVSSFWIERQSIMEIEIHSERLRYAIRSYSNTDNASVKLILKNVHHEKDFSFLKSNIDHILTIVQIYHLEISEVFINTLIQIIILLPRLDSLKVSSLSLKQSKCLSTNETELISLTSNKNQITKIYLEKVTDIEEIYYLLELCPRMIYLQIDSINNIGIESFIRNILIRINIKCYHQLGLLCFSISAADD